MTPSAVLKRRLLFRRRLLAGRHPAYTGTDVRGHGVMIDRRFYYRAMAALIGVSLLGGCAPSALWSGPGGPGSSPHEADADSQPRIESATLSESEPLPAHTGSIQVVDLLFDVIRVELPADTIQHSRKIWNHIDELRVEPQLVSRLARNGVRMGAVTEDAWPAVKTILSAGEAVVHRDRVQAQAGLPLALLVSTIRDRESIFAYGVGDRLAGKTFTAGDKLITVEYAYHPDFGGRVDLQISLEIRHNLGRMTWEREGGILREVPEYERHVFSSLRTVLALNPHESVLIGAGAEIDQEFLVGSRFFSEEDLGKRHEKMYFITPIIQHRPGSMRRAE